MLGKRHNKEYKTSRDMKMNPNFVYRVVYVYKFLLSKCGYADDDMYNDMTLTQRIGLYSGWFQFTRINFLYLDTYLDNKAMGNLFITN